MRPALFFLGALSLGVAHVHGSALKPDFTEDLAPILWQRCAGCHHPGGSGPFSVLTYSSVHKHAREIAEATASRHMPPWLPESGYGEFMGEDRLSAQQISLISKWVRNGAPEGPESALPPAPSQSVTSPLWGHSGQCLAMSSRRTRFAIPNKDAATCSA